MAKVEALPDFPISQASGSGTNASRHVTRNTSGGGSGLGPTRGEVAVTPIRNPSPSCKGPVLKGHSQNIAFSKLSRKKYIDNMTSRFKLKRDVLCLQTAKQF